MKYTVYKLNNNHYYKLQINVILHYVQRAPIGKTELLIKGAQPCTKQASFWQFCESPTQQKKAPSPRISR